MKCSKAYGTRPWRTSRLCQKPTAAGFSPRRKGSHKESTAGVRGFRSRSSLRLCGSFATLRETTDLSQRRKVRKENRGRGPGDSVTCGPLRLGGSFASLRGTTDLSRRRQGSQRKARPGSGEFRPCGPCVFARNRLPVRGPTHPLDSPLITVPRSTAAARRMIEA